LPTTIKSSKSQTFLEALVAALHKAGSYNKNDQAAPAAVLWPDKERQWEPLLPLLREQLPLLTLGEYNAEENRGPAYWIRCVLAGTIPDLKLPEGAIPIIYLPGISKTEIRAVEETPKLLQPLAELQYRGVVWTHRNGKDWTITAFMQSAENGLGLEVANDVTTREALRRALLKLAQEPIAELQKEAPLKAGYFYGLLTPDETRSMLQWLNDPVGYPGRLEAAEWGTFVDLSRSSYGIHPEKDGPLTAATLLGEGEGNWKKVWHRFKEAPLLYPQIAEKLRQVRRQPPLLSSDYSESWPPDNDAAENNLRNALTDLGNALPEVARKVVAELESEHGRRRDWVWATFGWTPLANSLKWLADLALSTQNSVGGATLNNMVENYTQEGWKADNAVMQSLAAVEQPGDVAAVKAVVNALYRPWLEKSANSFQKLVAQGQYSASILPAVAAGTCLIFSDGLRWDAAQRLVATLAKRKLAAKAEPYLAALPTITPTAKPAVSPVADLITGIGRNDLTPAVRASGSALTIENMRKLLINAGFQVLKGEETGDPKGRAWTELGAIDAYGHQHGWKIAHHLEGEIRALELRIAALLASGWSKIVVVTDHGWLMLPGGLPKADLPEHLTELRKGRCARLKKFATTDQQVVAWHWDKDVQIAIAAGICCYEAGKEYEHGGVSLQECVTPLLTITAESSGPVLEIEKISWRGLRCTVKISGLVSDLLLDLRTKAADPNSSIAQVIKVFNPDGTASILVQDEELEGQNAILVIFKGEASKMVLKQTPTVVGG